MTCIFEIGEEAARPILQGKKYSFFVADDEFVSESFVYAAQEDDTRPKRYLVGLRSILPKHKNCDPPLKDFGNREIRSQTTASGSRIKVFLKLGIRGKIRGRTLSQPCF